MITSKSHPTKGFMRQLPGLEAVIWPGECVIPSELLVSDTDREADLRPVVREEVEAVPGARTSSSAAICPGKN